MKQFQDKKKIRSKLYSITSIIILSILLIILVKAVWNIYQKEEESRKAREISNGKLLELKTRESKLLAETESLKTNLGLEEEIRSKFSVAKPGEEVILIVPKEKIAAPPEPTWSEKLLEKIKSFF